MTHCVHSERKFETRELVFYLSCGCIATAPQEAQLMAMESDAWTRACEEMVVTHVCPGEHGVTEKFRPVVEASLIGK